MTKNSETFREVQERVRAAEVRVAQQRETIARLREMGHAAEAEQLLLRTLEKQLARLIGQREQIDAAVARRSSPDT
jgi:hypothetical protein